MLKECLNCSWSYFKCIDPKQDLSMLSQQKACLQFWLKNTMAVLSTIQFVMLIVLERKVVWLGNLKLSFWPFCQYNSSIGNFFGHILLFSLQAIVFCFSLPKMVDHLLLVGFEQPEVEQGQYLAVTQIILGQSRGLLNRPGLHLQQCGCCFDLLYWVRKWTRKWHSGFTSLCFKPQLWPRWVMDKAVSKYDRHCYC